MLKLNRKLEYALIAIKFVAEGRIQTSNRLVSAKEIAEGHGLSFDVLSKVLQSLTHRGILVSEHGMKGGYRLCRSLEDINLRELSEIVVGPVDIARCLQSGKSQTPCNLESNCNIKAPITRLNRRIIDFYETILVSDLVADSSSESYLGKPNFSTSFNVESSNAAEVLR
ncbi:MAG: hypothetical protein COT74_04940 [Bdellovibrionales bacterium CG10_big_fil_rev_8_21_14_0_10_45_34]|nr:MAG: hypothetical protein COT74_04940 [Bdellovibrionales bacterium CG10_big_fil_rev_8_21_14_0_10_45_34]